MALWVAGRGWTYSANLAYARALADQGHEVTVLNTEAIKYRDLIPGGGNPEQHRRQATSGSVACLKYCFPFSSH